MFLANERQSTPVHVANNDGLDEVSVHSGADHSRHQDPTTAGSASSLKPGEEMRARVALAAASARHT